MRTLLEWLLSLFGTNNKAQKGLEDKIKQGEIELKGIEDEKGDIDDVINRFNK